MILLNNVFMILYIVRTGENDPPPLWGAQSNAIGQAIVCLLCRDPGKLDNVTRRLHGRQLPGGLRRWIWRDVLLRKEQRMQGDVCVSLLASACVCLVHSSVHVSRLF